MRKKNLLYVGLISLAILGMTACAKPPEALIQAAGAALNDAKGAQADLYASDALSRAQQLMNEADSMIKAQGEKFALFRSYKDAEAKLNEAKAAFDAAKQAAIDGKAAAKTAAEGLVTTATAALDDAAAKVAAAPKSKDSKADLEAYTNDIATYRQTLSEAQSAIASEDYLGAKSKLENVQAKAMEIAAAIQAVMDKAGKK